MKTEVGRDWYQSVHIDKPSCRQVSFSGPIWTPSREERKLFKAFSQHFDAIQTGWVSKDYSVGLHLLISCRHKKIVEREEFSLGVDLEDVKDLRGGEG
jgi:hypothetical protein